MGEKSPCYYCTTKRTPGCHDACKEFLKWQAENRGKMGRSNEADAFLAEQSVARKRRWHSKNRK